MTMLAMVTAACSGAREDNGGGAGADRGSGTAPAPLAVLAAGSLARPLRAALDSFRAQTGTPYTLETAGSLELARRLVDLGAHADIIALADEEVFPRLLMPSHVAWYARFARNRLVLAYSAKAPGVEAASQGDWRHVLQRPVLDVGRSDPDLDPAGYRTLMLFQLAERHYQEAGLARRLEASAPRRHVRPKSAELVALLQANELDYAWVYESTARGARLPFIALPPDIDLGDEARASTYAAARVRVLGKSVGDTLELEGGPIRYGLAIPNDAEHPAAGADFLRFLFSPAGAHVLRTEFLDALDVPALVGTGSPPFLDSLRASARASRATSASPGVAGDSARR